MSTTMPPEMADRILQHAQHVARKFLAGYPQDQIDELAADLCLRTLITWYNTPEEKRAEKAFPPYWSIGYLIGRHAQLSGQKLQKLIPQLTAHQAIMPEVQTAEQTIAANELTQLLRRKHPYCKKVIDGEALGFQEYYSWERQGGKARLAADTELQAYVG